MITAAGSLPTLYRNALAGWPPLAVLDFTTLATRFADRRVRVHHAPPDWAMLERFDRPADQRVPASPEAEATETMTMSDMKLGDVVPRILGDERPAPPGVDAVAAVDLETTIPALTGHDLPETVRRLGAVRAYLWLGPSGKSVPLHRDGVSGMLGQVCGRKRFRLLAPSDPGAAPAEVNVNLSRHRDIGAVDRSRFPDFDPARVVEVTVGPTDILFVPRGWWHQVDYLDACVSVNFWPPGYLGGPSTKPRGVSVP